MADLLFNEFEDYQDVAGMESELGFNLVRMLLSCFTLLRNSFLYSWFGESI